MLPFAVSFFIIYVLLACFSEGLARQKGIVNGHATAVCTPAYEQCASRAFISACCNPGHQCVSKSSEAAFCVNSDAIDFLMDALQWDGDVIESSKRRQGTLQNQISSIFDIADHWIRGPRTRRLHQVNVDDEAGDGTYGYGMYGHMYGMYGYGTYGHEDMVGQGSYDDDDGSHHTHGFYGTYGSYGMRRRLTDMGRVYGQYGDYGLVLGHTGYGHYSMTYGSHIHEHDGYGHTYGAYGYYGTSLMSPMRKLRFLTLGGGGVYGAYGYGNYGMYSDTGYGYGYGYGN